MDEEIIKSKKAVALKYKPKEDTAPKIAAKGRGYVAERILEIAREHNIPVREDRDLIEILYKLELEQEIPPEIYTVIAEVLAFIYRINKKRSPL